MDQYVVYAITEVVTGKQYVGLTKRWRDGQHIFKHFELAVSTLRNPKGRMALHEAMLMYPGKDLPEMFQIVELGRTNNKARANRLVANYIGSMGTRIPHGYNGRRGGGISKMSKETRQKISETAKRTWAAKTQEERDAIQQKRALTMARRYGITDGDGNVVI